MFFLPEFITYLLTLTLKICLTVIKAVFLEMAIPFVANKINFAFLRYKFKINAVVVAHLFKALQ